MLVTFSNVHVKCNQLNTRLVVYSLHEVHEMRKDQLVNTINQLIVFKLIFECMYIRLITIIQNCIYQLKACRLDYALLHQHTLTYPVR